MLLDLSEGKRGGFSERLTEENIEGVNDDDGLPDGTFEGSCDVEGIVDDIADGKGVGMGLPPRPGDRI